MQSGSARWTAALVLSSGALLSFLTRTFIDYLFVYQELGYTTAAIGWLTLFNLAFFGAWIWALVSASHRGRRAMVVLLVYAALLVVYGFITLLSFCPSPCRTLWPVGEIAIWSNLVIGVGAIVLGIMALFSKESGRGEP